MVHHLIRSVKTDVSCVETSVFYENSTKMKMVKMMDKDAKATRQDAQNKYLQFVKTYKYTVYLAKMAKMNECDPLLF